MRSKFDLGGSCVVTRPDLIPQHGNACRHTNRQTLNFTEQQLEPPPRPVKTTTTVEILSQEKSLEFSADGERQLVRGPLLFGDYVERKGLGFIASIPNSLGGGGFVFSFLFFFFFLFVFLFLFLFFCFFCFFVFFWCMLSL